MLGFVVPVERRTPSIRLRSPATPPSPRTCYPSSSTSETRSASAPRSTRATPSSGQTWPWSSLGVTSERRALDASLFLSRKGGGRGSRLCSLLVFEGGEFLLPYDGFTPGLHWIVQNR